MDIIYLDFQKAFDKVPHSRLILKLAAHGISGDVPRQCRIKVGAIDAAALGPFVK